MNAQLQTNALETNAQLFAVCNEQKILSFMESEMSKAGFPPAYTVWFIGTLEATSRGRINRSVDDQLGKPVAFNLTYTRAELAP